MGRGLFRIWLVLTVLWAAFVLLASGQRPDVAFEAIVIPSGVVLVVGVMLRWAFRGFSI